METKWLQKTYDDAAERALRDSHDSHFMGGLYSEILQFPGRSPKVHELNTKLADAYAQLEVAQLRVARCCYQLCSAYAELQTKVEVAPESTGAEKEKTNG